MTFGDSNLDILVSQVNQQIGALMRRDLGLGLLFVIGEVKSVTCDESQRPTSFVLSDGEYELRADLAPSLRHPPALRAGQHVRATAWLGFYYPDSRFRLIVRDLEIVEPIMLAPAPPAAVPAPPPIAAEIAPPPELVPVAEIAPAAPFEPAAPPAAEPELAAPPEAAAPAIAIEPGILPPWLEEIRRRQFGFAAAPEPAPETTAAEALARGDTLTGAARPAAPAPEELVPAAPAPDAELQTWLAQLFDASEAEDIELTRQQEEIVAVRTQGRQDHFRALGAATLARLNEPEPAPAPAPEAASVLPPPPPAAQELLRQETVVHRPVLPDIGPGAAPSDLTRPTQAVTQPLGTLPAGRMSPLQSPAPTPQPIESAPSVSPALIFILVVILGLIVLGLTAAATVLFITYFRL